MSDDSLSGGFVVAYDVSKLTAQRDSLMVQKDALLAACEAAERIISRLPRRAALRDKLRAAIALAKETSE